MKKHLVNLILIAGLGFLPWGAAQGTRANLFDSSKMQHDLEIMKGILSTTLSFFAKDYAARETLAKLTRNELFRESWRFSSINAFYLYGQGATFVVPMSGLRLTAIKEVPLLAGLSDLESQELEMGAVQEALRATQQALSDHQLAMSGRGASPSPVPAPQPPPAPPAPSVSGAPQKQGKTQEKLLEKQEEIREKLAEAQAKVKKRREQSELSRQKFLTAVAEAKVYLLEALANHGDSLTQVKPNEYINLVIAGDGKASGFTGFDLFEVGGSSSGTQILSVQKSVITDYKAGKLTLDAFKQKVLQYSN